MSAKFGARLHDGLLARGYVVETEFDSPDSFGSWYKDYIRPDQRVRLLWDGRDQWFVLQGGKQWRDLAIRRPSELADGIDEFLAHAD